MNKKTTRLSSIALALMMVLMVALTLVPVSAAFAATSVDVDVEAGSTLKKFVKQPTSGSVNVKISVSEYDFDLTNYDGVYIAVIQPDGNYLSGYEVDDKVKMTKASDGTLTYSLEMKSTYDTGLYKVSLYPYKGNDHYTSSSHSKLSAFYYAKLQSKLAPEFSDASASGTEIVANTASTKLYTTSGKEITITIKTSGGAYGNPGTLYLVDPITGTIMYEVAYSTIASGTTAGIYVYTVPDAAVHGDELEFDVFAVSSGSVNYCDYNTADAVSALSVTTKKVYIDKKGPEVGDIKLTSGGTDGKIKPDTLGILFDKVGRAATYQIELSKAKDSDVGLDATPDIAYQFANRANKNDVVKGTGIFSAWTAAGDGYIYDATGAYISVLGAAAGDDVVKLINEQWELTIIAKDQLGNETKAVYDNKVVVYDTYTTASSIRVESQNVFEMYVGQTLTLDEIEDRNVVVKLDSLASFYGDAWVWVTSNNANGVISYDSATNTLTANRVGTGQLTAQALAVYDGDTTATPAIGTVNDYLTVNVVAEPTVKSISLNNSAMNIAPGATQKLTATTDPSGVAITWETNNSAVATVSADGTVTGVANGTAVIFAKAGAQVASCTVTVSGGSVTVTGISLNKTAMSLTAGASETLFATTTPAGGAISWNTSDASVATVDNAGKVTAQKAGTATITATSGSYSATCVVTVTGTPETLEPNQWYQDDAGNIYYSNEHSQLTVGWKKIGGYWYLFDYSTAVMKKGWAKDAGTWYYLQSDGKMKTGWLKDGSTWYYLQASGAMKTGWLKDGGVWYYLKDSGAMATGWVKVSGIWYYLQGSGAMKEGWLLESGVWYYLTPSSGAMLANGTYTVEGRKSQFAASGRWLGYV